MAILVLGRAGYIGSHMVDRLVNEGQEKVVVVDSLVTGHRAAVHPDAVFYQGDLADQDFMRTVFKDHADIDAVIHFAAYSLVAESMADPLKYFDNNTAGMVKLLEVMHECGGTLYRLFFNRSDLRYSRRNSDPRNHSAKTD